MNYEQKLTTSRLLHGLVGCVFVISGLVKGWHIQGFAGHLNTLGNPFPDFAIPVTTLLFWLEISVGCMLVSGYRLRVSRRIAQAMLVCFIGYLGALTVYGHGKPCGCFGALINTSPIVMAVIDAMLFLILAFVDRYPVPGTTRSLKLGFMVSWFFLMAVAWVGAQTSVFDALVLRLRPGFTMTSLPSLDPNSKTASKKLVVALINTMPDATQISAMKKAASDAELVLIDTSGGLAGEAAGVPIMRGKPDIMHYYVHHHPTVFMIDNGLVTQVWYGRLP
ncbi:MAG: hypothetical protein KDC35_13215 [Acidobacteria bacterium]|nr:hypothetical protein [Acidobacteriota bacterium]